MEFHRVARLHPTRLTPIAVLITIALFAPLPTLAQSSSTNPIQNVVEEDGYLLGAGDRIKIDFFSVTEFSGEYQVLPNGTVNLPQVGAVAVRGKTLKQAAQGIANRYEPILQRPVITVSLLIARPVTIAIAGEVNRPGSYALPLSEANNNPRLTRLLQLAEGITQAADLRRVQIRRPSSVNPSQDDVMTVDLWELVQQGNIRQDVQLRDGDSIFVPATPIANLDEARQLAAVNFASRSDRPIKISVVGAVNRPGPHTLDTQAAANVTGTPAIPQVPSVTRAIQTAGGITQYADIRNIEVRRPLKTGADQRIKIDFWSLFKSGDLRQDLPLQDGDTIEVPIASAISDREATELASASFSPEKISVNVVGEVERSGTVAVPPNTPLNQALLAAGGLNKRANRRTVTLVRLNLNGTVSKRDIALDFARGLDEQGNPALRNNDTVIVKRSAIAGIGDTVGTVLSPFSGIFGLVRLLGL